MKMQTQEQETAGRQRPRKQLNSRRRPTVRAEQPALNTTPPWRDSLAALPAIANFTRLFNFSDNEGRSIEVHRNGAGRLIIDESFCQFPVGKRTDLYANLRQRRFTTAEALCDFFVSLLTPEDYEALGNSLVKRQEAEAAIRLGKEGAS